MEYNPQKKEIESSKTLNALDRFTIDFVSILEKYSEYVIVSGYVSIVLGRTRASEDVDLLVNRIDFFSFKKLFDELFTSGFECANTSDAEEAYQMWNEHAIRFYRNQPLPTMECKLVENEIQKLALRNRIKLVIKEKTLYLSPLELQIAYKLSLMSKGDFEEISSDKDFEDAKHLYDLFKDKLNISLLLHFIDLFKVRKEWEWLQK